jgi:hypothetical protein
MKTKTSEPATLKENSPRYGRTDDAMIRTQIYLTRVEYEFLSSEASRRNEPMAAVIRELVDEKMRLPDDAWTSNPMLRETPNVEGWEGHEDGALNHDHYIYGGPKQYEKVKGKWVLLPGLEK